MSARLSSLLTLVLAASAHSFSVPAPKPSVSLAWDPVSLLSAAKFLADEMGDELPLKTPPARVALFLASLNFPGSLPNAFATTRWEPKVYTATIDNKVVGVIQTALANAAPGEVQLQTVRFFQNVVVASDWRRKGVATALLDFADGADLRYPSALAVEPSNEAAVRLYERRGFRICEGEPMREGSRLMLRTAEPGAVVDDPEASDWRARSGGPPVMMASSEMEWRKQQSGDPTGSDESTRKRVDEMAAEKRRAESLQALNVREATEASSTQSVSSGLAVKRLQDALQRADAQKPQVAKEALLNAIGEAHMAGVAPDDEFMRQAAARIAAVEKAGSMDDPSEGSDWRARSGGPPVMMASSSSTSETEWRRRALLLHAAALPLAPIFPASAAGGSLFQRLRARYILLRPGETTFEAAAIVDSNPINKGQSERGLTEKGRKQVEKSVERLKAMGVTSPQIFFDNGVRATQTADILSQSLGIPRKDVEPEFRWLEARGLGVLDGTDLRAAKAKLAAMDSQDIDNAPEPTDDGTPGDSVNDVIGRMTNTITKIEQTYGGGDFIIIPGDSTVLSVFAAAACGVDLREHARFELRPGEFYDLRELQKQWKAGTFEPMALALPTDDEVKAGRSVLNEMGPKIFAETGAGSCLCCACAR